MPRGYPGTKSPHGTITRYFSQGCRCEKCGAARRAYCGNRPRAQYLAERYREPPPHGTESRYTNHKCRCDECKRAANDARQARRRKNPERDRAYQREYAHKRQAAA